MFPFANLIIINKELSRPVYKQIALSLMNAIRDGQLMAETPLPGSRELAKTLGLHRKTVIAAYEELAAQDWITIVPRKRVTVSKHIPLLKPQKWDETTMLSSYENPFKLPFRVLDDNYQGLSLSLLPDVMIDDGHPDVRLSPIDELLKTYRTLTSRNLTIKNAHIGTEQGTKKLREELVLYLAKTRGLNITADNILITHGAQMSIYLSARQLLNARSNVIVGKPNYPVANKTFNEAGAKLIEVNVDQYGIDTDEIEEICKKKSITAVYVIPHHHYPTTVTLSVERRMKLLNLSNEYKFAIIEDDYDYDYHYTSSPYLPLASSKHQGNIIYIGSFSKILDPSLRLGFMIAPKNFIDQCVVLRKLIDAGGDGYMQNALADLIKSGELKRHVTKAKKKYHIRRDFLDNLLKSQLNNYVSYTLPSGGMAIWLKIIPEISVLQLANNSKLKINRITEGQNAFRFGFASMNENELTLAVNHLRLSMETIQSKSPKIK